MQVALEDWAKSCTHTHHSPLSVALYLSWELDGKEFKLKQSWWGRFLNSQLHLKRKLWSVSQEDSLVLVDFSMGRKNTGSGVS